MKGPVRRAYSPMLVIRQQQLQQFETVIFDRFLDNCVTHVYEQHPRTASKFPDEASLRAFTLASINRGIFLNFREYSHLVKFLDWECRFGEKFYDKEEWAWAKAILDNGLHPSIRIHRIDVRLDILRQKGKL